MRKLFFLVLFLGVSIGSQAQKNIRKAYILRDGVEITYAEYKLINLTEFAEIRIIPENKEIVKIFGKKAGRGLVHLKSFKFIKAQNARLDSLKASLKNDTLRSTLIIINGVPYSSEPQSASVIDQLNHDNIEVIEILDNTGTTFAQKKLCLILTNKEI